LHPCPVRSLYLRDLSAGPQVTGHIYTIPTGLQWRYRPIVLMTLQLLIALPNRSCTGGQ
jgi:hypothetical protein